MCMHTYSCMCAAIQQNGAFLISVLQSAETVEYTNCISAEGEDPHPASEWPGYDIEQSDDEVPVMLELWGMQSTPSFPLLPGPLRPGVVAPDRALSMG